MKKVLKKNDSNFLFKFSLIFCIGLFNLQVFSQNLVTNWSFEDHTSCPTWFNQIERINGWFKAHENIGTDTSISSDYFNNCGSVNFNVPRNVWGYQAASTGDAYVVIVSMSPSIFTNYRENIYSKLIEPMKPNNEYHVSLKVNKTNICKYATNNIGIKFSTTTSFPINNFAHINSINIITDTLGWYELQGSFIADSAYEYIAIGSFYTDVNTLTIQSCPTCSNPNYGYNIDDVCVVLRSDENCLIPYIASKIEEFDVVESSFFPNPFNDFTQLNLNRKIENGCLTIYDQLGKKVKVIENITNETIIKRENLKSGMYHFILTNNKKIVDKGNLIISE